jgi:hypothetical protein
MRTGAVRNGVTMRTACASGRRRSGSSSRDMASCVGRAEPSTCWRTLAGGQQQGKPAGVSPASGLDQGKRLAHEAD